MQRVKRNAQHAHQISPSSTQQPHPGQTSNSYVENQHSTQSAQPVPHNGQSSGQSAQNAPAYGQGSGQSAQNAPAYGQGLGHGTQSPAHLGQGTGQSAQNAPAYGQGLGHGTQSPAHLGQGTGQSAQNAPAYGQGLGYGTQSPAHLGQGTGQSAQNASAYGQGLGHSAQPTPAYGQGSAQTPAYGPNLAQGAQPISHNGQNIAQGAPSPSPYGPNIAQQPKPALHGGYLAQDAQHAAHNGYYYGGAPSYQQFPANKQSGSMESILVKYVLPIVFIVVLLIGILMLFIAGVAYGLLTEPVRCLLGLLLATGMYIFGMLQQRFKRPIWGKSLLGGAHGIFIITVSIAHLSYEIIGVFLAALAYALAFALIIFSAVRWRSQLLVCIAVFTGYLCMFLIDVSNVHIVTFIVVQLIFSISMILLSIKLNYRIAYWFAYLLLHFSLLITYNLQEYTSHKLLLAALIIQQLAVFVVFVRSKLTQIEHSIVQLIGIITLISWTGELYHVPGGISPTYAIVTLSIAVLYAGSLLYFERQLSREQDSESNELLKPLSSLLLRTEISTIVIAIALLCFFIEILGTSFMGLVLLLIGVSLVLYGVRDVHHILRWCGAVLSFLGAVAIIFDYPSKLLSYEILSWLIMLISIPLIYRECREQFTDSPGKRTLLATLLWIEAVLLWIFVTIVAALLGEHFTSDASPYIISSAWLLYALGAIILGTVRKLTKARLTGIILLLIIVIKVIFIDMTFLNILSKSIIFTVLGGIGILVSFFLYNRTDEDKQQRNV